MFYLIFITIELIQPSKMLFLFVRQCHICAANCVRSEHSKCGLLVSCRLKFTTKPLQQRFNLDFLLSSCTTVAYNLCMKTVKRKDQVLTEIIL